MKIDHRDVLEFAAWLILHVVGVFCAWFTSFLFLGEYYNTATVWFGAAVLWLAGWAMWYRWMRW